MTGLRLTPRGERVTVIATLVIFVIAFLVTGTIESRPLAPATSPCDIVQFEDGSTGQREPLACPKEA